MSGVGDDIQAREARHVLQTYKRLPVTFVRGEGVRLFDLDGREYYDLLSGIGVSSLGYGHPRLGPALADQAMTLLHTSNLFYHPLQGQAAERLSSLSGLSRVFFCNSGTEAVEACLKFTRRYWYTLGETRPEVIAIEESFHGRTLGSLAVTSDEHYRAPFGPLAPVRWIPLNDVDALKAAVTTNTAAVIIEALQGEGGIRSLTPAFAQAITEICERTGSLIIADEVQCGLGRTGYPFHYRSLGLKPHLVALGKALGAGVPVGATLVADQVASKIAYGDHGTTYGGNLLACRAALVFLEELVGGGLLTHVGRVGAYFQSKLRDLATRHPLVKEVRGSALMAGLELHKDALAVVGASLERGLIVNRTAETVIRMLPPLVITEADIDEALSRLESALSAVEAA